MNGNSIQNAYEESAARNFADEWEERKKKVVFTGDLDLKARQGWGQHTAANRATKKSGSVAH